MSGSRKLAAHDKWVCVGCRWTAKIPRVDVRSSNCPSYRCPKCGVTMLWTGTAFRPPRKQDDEAWSVLEGLFAAGFRFDSTSERGRVPRTRKELEAWRRERESPDGWLPECPARVRRGDAGPVVHGARRALTHGERVLLWHEGAWSEGWLRLQGDGGLPLANPVVVALARPHRAVMLTAGSRLRLRRDRP
jgi:hypothetical protein